MSHLHNTDIAMPRQTTSIELAPRPQQRHCLGLEEPAWLKSGQIPSLDGWRAISILLVIFYHLSLGQNSPLPVAWQGLAQRGAVGVDFFFAISGFLISTLLFREWDSTHQIDIAGFYYRRTQRILPPLLAYLVVVFALSRVGYLSIPGRDWLAAATYTINFFDHVAIPLGHLWSLSVEEHFYLLWPLVVAAMGPRRSGWIALFTLASQPFLRYVTSHGTNFDCDFVTWTRLDAIAAGCLLAVVVRGDSLPRITRAILAYSHERFGLAWLLLLVCVAIPHDEFSAYGRVQPTLLACSFTWLLWLSLSRDAGVSYRLLNHPVLTSMGRMSYGLYLWQQLFLDWSHNWWLGAFPQNLLCAVGCAALSYWLIELPLLRRRRLSVVPAGKMVSDSVLEPDRQLNPVHGAV